MSLHSLMSKVGKRFLLTFGASLIVVSIVGGSNTLEDGHSDDVIRQVSLSETGAPIIVLSDAEDIDYVTDSLRHGVRGHIPTATTLNVAIKAMQLVLVGGVYVPASNFLTARHSVAKVGAGDETIVLTKQQSAVVDAVRQGKANKVIAHELNISESTVKVHLHNVMKKLQVKNRTEVAVKARKTMRPVAQSDGHDAPRLFDEFVPGVAAMIDDVVV